jgi:predicted transcriptional regulator
MAQTILEMAKDLVTAQIKAGGFLPEELHTRLQKAYMSLVELKAREDAGHEAILGPINGSARPAGNWKKSIRKYTITCLECGATFKQLSVRHLKDHELDPQSYRAKYGIPRTQPLSAKDTTATRKQIVQRSRPWEKAPTFMKARAGKAKTTTPDKTRV